MHNKKIKDTFDNLQLLLNKLSKEGVFSADELKIINEFQDSTVTFLNNSESPPAAVTPKNDILLPWNDVSFVESWNEWKAHLLEQYGVTYKPMSETRALKSLVKKSDNDMLVAIQIIEYSVGNVYRGLFTLKQVKKISSRAKTENLNNIDYDG